ncbi:uncharacterized protein BO96DRAFT_462091 [Aspergillus niger CBS 101883]|uniref:uncharacterized protein n=1 Tax=Aspergillus lacticoffeatus (strain CBS 101883) TaxID=1450533 RepID=UPI000D800859|nr:uncharacterized protein BO96DRAFT_462091 [Aspergillus niger CBS 101883]PYH63050.1 hypothetical protein BO96DRAFT_462091 [Aspergillus niger CBS 101883]
MPDSVSAPKADGQSRDVPAILQTEKIIFLIFVSARQVPVSTSMGSGPMGRKRTGSQTENETIVALRVETVDFAHSTCRYIRRTWESKLLPKLSPETKQLTRDTCCRYPSRHQPAPTQKKIDSLQRPMIAGQTVGNASPMASSRVTEPTLHDMICADPVAAQKRSTCTPFELLDSRPGIHLDNATALPPANQIEGALCGLPSNNPEDNHDRVKRLARYPNDSRQRTGGNDADRLMQAAGNKRDLIKNQRPRTRRATNAAGKEVILERSTERIPSIMAQFGEDFAQPVKGLTSQTRSKGESSHSSAVIFIILATTTPVMEKGKYHFRRNFEVLHWLYGEHQSEARNRFFGRDGQKHVQKVLQYFDDQLLSAFIRNGPSSALALPVRPRDRGWSCERPEPARQFLQVFGPTIADYQTLVNDRLNLRWVQEPSKTTRRTIWMLFPPPTNWGIRSPLSGKKDDVLLKRSVRHCIVPCRNYGTGNGRGYATDAGGSEYVQSNHPPPPSATTGLMRDDRLAPSVSLIISLDGRCWIPCQWSPHPLILSLHTAYSSYTTEYYTSHPVRMYS